MRKPLHKLGIKDGYYYSRGECNNITDVSGIKVGHSTIIEGDNVRTGVTAIIPEGLFDVEYAAGGLAFNANGEMTGLQYVLEEGKVFCPIFLTNTVSVGDVSSAVVNYYKGKIALPYIGECWDGWLNDIWGMHVKKSHVVQAIESAKVGEIEQGCVGAGTGMTSFGFKSGIGSSSRKIKILDKVYTLGVLVNNNMSHEDGRHRYLRFLGADVAKIIGEYEKNEKIKEEGLRQNNSSILIIATDVSMDSRQLNRLARHAVLGFGRDGFVSYTGSGDFVLAFSTGNKLPRRETKVEYQTTHFEETLLDEVFEATLEAVEESYLNSLLTAETMMGKDGHTANQFPVEKITPFIK